MNQSLHRPRALHFYLFIAEDVSQNEDDEQQKDSIQIVYDFRHSVDALTECSLSQDRGAPVP